MGKKTRYSKPLSEMWDSYNASNKKGDLTPKEFIQRWLYPQIINPFMPDGKPTQRNILIADMFLADTRKEFLHIYFVDKSLRDWLKDLPIKDFDTLMKFIVENGLETKAAITTTFGQTFKTEIQTMNFDFGIHIPFENKHRGYAFSFIVNPQDKKLVFVFSQGQDADYFTVDTYKDLLKEKSDYSEKVLSFFRLAVNTIAYMKAFPECVTDGVPKNENGEYACNLDISEKVVESVKNTNSNRMVAPHFRKGFWKVLRSDYFTHKKGQIIFVSETMVNGVAKTVEKSTDKEKLDNFSK